MPEPEYTPGAWREHNGTIMVGDEVLAIVFRGKNTWPEHRATARVMAASQDALEALEAVAIMPWGYCVCPPRMGDMEGKPDDAHCGECRQVRAAIAKAKGE